MITPKITLSNRRGSHWYDVEDYGLYPSVTTIIGATMPKPALAAWGKKVALEDARRVLLDRENLPQDIRGMSAEAWAKFVDELIAKAKDKPKQVASEAADLGTRAHKAIEQYLKGETYEITEDIEPCFQGFLQWKDESGIEITHSEQRVFCPETRVAGSVDIFGRRGGKRIVADFKSSKGIYADYAYQAGGYAICWEFMTGENVEEGWIIRLAKDPNDPVKFEAKQVSNLVKAKQGFKLLRRLFDFNKVEWFA